MIPGSEILTTQITFLLTCLAFLQRFLVKRVYFSKHMDIYVSDFILEQLYDANLHFFLFVSLWLPYKSEDFKKPLNRIQGYTQP